MTCPTLSLGTGITLVTVVGLRAFDIPIEGIETCFKVTSVTVGGSRKNNFSLS